MSYVASVIELARKRNPAEWEFHQAVGEVFRSLEVAVEKQPRYRQNCILERLIEPDRVLMFRVPWLDDQGAVQVHRGFLVEMNNAIGPYKGGLRFHSSVTLGIIKFLAFEQVFKNSLTSLPMGGGEGGSDFNPRGKSDREVQSFCQSFMTELAKHIGARSDVPGRDTGIGLREIGYLFGQYKRLRNEFSGALTDKGVAWGGSVLHPESTGYGVAFFAQEMLATWSDSLQDKVCTVSGAGVVAQHTARKILDLGGKVVSMSDSNGTIHDPDGIDAEKLDWIQDLKNVRRGRIREYAEAFRGAEYREGQRPWSIPCDCAFPCATENEITGREAKALLDNGCFLVCEGANMPTDPDGVRVFLSGKILYGPSKAANAGGAVVAGFEISQNAQRLRWTREEVEKRLQSVIESIHARSRAMAEEYGHKDNLLVGANIASFVKLADAMVDQGLV